MLVVFLSNAQEPVTGVVLDVNSNPIPGASVSVQALKNKGAASDLDGKFSIALPIGTHRLEITYVGYKTQTVQIKVTASQASFVTIVLEEDIAQLSDVIVNGKTTAQKTKEKAFEVEVIDTKPLKNMSVDINTALTTIPGVNVRQRGGLGAGFDFSLNGLSGKQIKFFMDGIPLENFGSSLTLNNFPATLVERVEVYKGVVPVHLGADALGGAVNIITNRKKNSFLDLSYDAGSFNTHRATLSSQYYNKKGWLIQFNSFYNYSDNNYTIDDIVVRDDLGNDTGERAHNVERFHDAYKSQMITVKAGLTDKAFADRFIVGLTSSGNRNEIQHPIDPQNPFGEVFTKNEIISGSIDYEKNAFLTKKLKLKAYASLSRNREKVVDTSARKYDWFGNYKERGDQTLGEFESRKTLFKFTDDLHVLNALATYKFNTTQEINFSYTKNYIKREGDDPARSEKIAFEEPHIVNKNIFGLSYDFKLMNAKWHSSLFTKGYLLNSEGIIEDLFASNEDRLTPFKNTFEELGYGFASTFKIIKDFQIKGSFEKTFRIPEGYEVFGDGFLLKSNTELLPEQSYNVNLGLLFNTGFNDFKFQFDTNTFLRISENFIAIRSEGIFSRYYNTANARSTGVEGELRTLYKERYFLDINTTYQNVIDLNAGENAGVDFLKNQRIANIPYLFGNVRLGGKFKDLFAEKDQFNISWNTYYVADYPLTSYVEGSPEERNTIPQQISHNLQVGYSFNDGTYNLSLSIRNLTDAKVYDNFEIQQPGRAIYFKLRYYLSN